MASASHKQTSNQQVSPPAAVPTSAQPRPSSSQSSGSSASASKSPPLPDRNVAISLPRTHNRREPPPLPHHPVGDMEAREEMWSRELEEARTRLAQMEKTMRWWCDCTASWREKWSKVRNERNKARDDCKRLRTKLETCAKDCSALRVEREQLTNQLSDLTARLGTTEGVVGTWANHNKDSRLAVGVTPLSQSGESLLLSENIANTTSGGVAHKSISSPANLSDGVNKTEGFMCELLARHEQSQDNGESEHSKDGTTQKKSPSKSHSNSHSTAESAALQQKITTLTAKLEEAQKTIQAEREEKLSIMKSVEELQVELTSLKAQQDEIKASRTNVLKQLTQLQNEHRDELGRVAADLEDEYSNRADMDSQVAELRKELEKLQADNAQEWGKRERLESDKLALGRENRKLRAEVAHLEEDLLKKSQHTSALLDGDLKTLQFDLTEKNKELTELRLAHGRVKKSLQEKGAELEHCKSRNDQYEAEVRRLRTRVDELKHSHATAEDEVDQQANQIRRLQRTNDELQVQCENLQVQVEHLQTRLRSSSNPILSVRPSSHKKFTLNDSLPTTDDEQEPAT